MTAKKTEALQTKYALSILLKHGEVLHIEGIGKEEKDQYLALAREPGTNMLLESKHELRQLRSDDIAKVSIVAYNANYESTWLVAKKMLFGETTVGRWIFSFLIKFFVFLCVVIGLAQLGLKVVDGTIMDVLFDPTQFVSMLDSAFAQMGTFFKYIFALMLLLNLLDFALGLRKDYYVNQEGSPWVEYTAVSNVALTAGLLIGFTVVKGIIGGVVGLM